MSYTLTTSNTAGPFGAVGRVTAPGGILTNMDRVNMQDLNSEVFNAKIDDLINLWVARYGNEWVDLVDIEGDEFYLRVYKRLRQTGQLEQHYLTDRSRFVCRKPE
jgi:hypothetical protein